MGLATIEEAIEDYRQGKFVIIVDDEDRENEGDLCQAAEFCSPQSINFMAKYGRGLICMPIIGERLDERDDARVGGDFCITLAYDLPTGSGKTTPERDTYQGRFLELVPNERVVELHTFVTDDAALQGQMTVTFTLEDAGTGTFLSAIHDGLPPGLSPEDNEVGWAMALRKLAAYLESPAAPSALR